MTIRQRLLADIEAAFRGVELGDGVSLRETVVIDNCGSAGERAAARAADELADWRRLINDPGLARTGGVGGIGGLAFYDAPGLRFHLPAYLSLAVIDFERADAKEVLGSLLDQLADLSDSNRELFSVLTAAQRGCVRDVLVFVRDEHDLDPAFLDPAIDGYWAR